MKVLIKRLDPELPLPSYAKPGDAGADIYSRIDAELNPGERKLIPTGIAIALPPGFAAFCAPKIWSRNKGRSRNGERARNG